MSAIDIKSIRTRLGVTQETLAQILGVSFQTVNRWENKGQKPSNLAIEKIKKLEKRQNERS